MKKLLFCEIGGSTLSLETGTMAKQANGAVLVQYGETVVLVTACSEEEAKPHMNFLPLTVDYLENTYSAGKIPGGFFKREGKPRDKEVLTSRLIDRAIRPLFPPLYRYETQVIANVISFDRENNSDFPSLIGASAALLISDIPFSTTLACVRVGLVDGEYSINPTMTELEESRMDFLIAATKEGVVMIEGEAKEVSEEEVLQAIDFAQPALDEVIRLQEELTAEAGRPKRALDETPFPTELIERVRTEVGPELDEAIHTAGKIERNKAMSQVRELLIERIGVEEEDEQIPFLRAFDELQRGIVRTGIAQNGQRYDGREASDIRPIDCHVGFLPRVHGSALFTRGETQALVTTTLGMRIDEQTIDALKGRSSKRFMLHYNFPPFSVGEVRFLRAPKRREIGHGDLAERALKPMIPSEEAFPYTLRVVSDIMESNGSSSMASVCGASLALMDAGVPIHKAVAGMAMGLIKENDHYAILTDIAGDEDHYGDMDLKVAGTREGITAIQMDLKISELPDEILRQALDQAKTARHFILDKMAEALAEPRQELSRHAPKLITLKIAVDKIRDVIGPGGRMIRSIIERTNTQIDVDDDGTICISGEQEGSAKEAAQIIKSLITDPEVGNVYRGTVKKVVDYGAFVEIKPGTQGLVHISEVSEEYIEDLHTELNEGDELLVKVIGIDARDRIKLSHKAVLDEAQDSQLPESQ